MVDSNRNEKGQFVKGCKPFDTTGRSLSEEHKQKIRDFMKNRDHSYKIGRKVSDETRRKLSESHKGDKSSLWRGGISQTNKTERKLAMNSVEYKIWRTSVFESDNYTCQECAIRGGVELNADHIKPWVTYPDLRYEVDNGRTLCVDCHRKTPTWGSKVHSSETKS